MVTKREFLAGLNPPLAKMGRGKFSAAGHEALAKALAEGMTFDLSDAEKAKLDREVKKAAKGNAPKDAPADGEPLQKAAAVVEKATEPTPDKHNYSPAAPRTRQSKTFVGNDGGTEVKLSDSEACVECGYSFSHCSCFTPNSSGQTGPFKYASKGSTDTLVSFVGV